MELRIPRWKIVGNRINVSVALWSLGGGIYSFFSGSIKFIGTIEIHPQFYLFLFCLSVGVEDWLRLQRILDAGGALDEDGRVWRASIIAADDENGNPRTYLGTLERG